MGATDPGDDELLELLADCGEWLARPSNPINAMGKIVRRVGQSLDADRMTYFVRDPSAGVSHCISAWAREGLKPIQPGPYRDEDFVEVITPLSREEVYSTTLATKSGRNLQVNEESGTTADLLVPVIVQGQLRGILTIDQCRGQAAFPARQVSALRALAVMIASALGRFDAEDVRSSVMRQQHLVREAAAESAADVVRELLSISDLDRALERVLPRIGSMAACQRVSLLMRDHIEGRPRHRLFKEWMAPGQPSESELGFGVLFDDEALPGALTELESGSPFWWRNSTGRQDALSIRNQTLGITVCGGLPLLVEGHYTGVVCFGWCYEPSLGVEGVEFRVLQLAANAVAAALQRQRAVERRIEQERELLAERSRMAREIHDGVAQGFTGILMQLGTLAQSKEYPADVKIRARRAADLARQGLADARRAVMALQPEGSSREDLASALAHLVECVSVPRGIDCAFHTEGCGFDASLGPARSHELFRVVQEALNNSLRHAQARRIDVTLSRTSTGIRVQVEDDGVGFVEVGGDGFGIRNMCTRVQDMGGSLLIDSTPGAGTRVIADIPPSA
ncbi:GAF domain-containing sensor histidine kinase [Povalibacter sp.]|uniref:GAF domain-containing sensor histidine kinase n=1 Tax=Povalibacter sp. TaxID=1962978 RepID=UPI002F3FC206